MFKLKLITQVTCDEISLRNHQEEAATFLCVELQCCWLPQFNFSMHPLSRYWHLYIGNLFLTKDQFWDLCVFTGVKERTRVLKISNIALDLREDVFQALPALHSFSGNDYTSSFHRKNKSLKCVAKLSWIYCNICGTWWKNVTFDITLFELIKWFVFKLYSLKDCTDVNEGRYVEFT